MFTILQTRTRKRRLGIDRLLKLVDEAIKVQAHKGRFSGNDFNRMSKHVIPNVGEIYLIFSFFNFYISWRASRVCVCGTLTIETIDPTAVLEID